MSRQSDRRHTFNLIFQWEFNKDEPSAPTIARYFEQQTYMAGARLPAGADIPFVERLLNGTLEHIADIDKLIAGNAQGWELTRLAKTDLAILRMSIYEILYDPDIPPKVAVNEALELSRMYSGGDSPSFVNGVLAQVIKSIQGT